MLRADAVLADDCKWRDRHVRPCIVAGAQGPTALGRATPGSLLSSCRMPQTTAKQIASSRKVTENFATADGRNPVSAHTCTVAVSGVISYAICLQNAARFGRQAACQTLCPTWSRTGRRRLHTRQARCDDINVCTHHHVWSCVATSALLHSVTYHIAARHSATCVPLQLHAVPLAGGRR